MEKPHKLVNGVRVDLNDAEIAQREVDRLAHEAKQKANEWLEKRLEAYKEKGWKDPFDVLDDMSKRGVDVVLAERKAIKDANPKSGV